MGYLSWGVVAHNIVLCLARIVVGISPDYLRL